jgi:hypothetical protein
MMVMMEEEDKEKAMENKKRNSLMQFKDLAIQIHIKANTDSNMLIRCMELTGICFIISKRVSVFLWSMQSLGCAQRCHYDVYM